MTHQAFIDFIKSGLDPESVDINDIHHVFKEWSILAVPTFILDPSWMTDSRRQQWPSKQSRMVDRLYFALAEQERKNIELQGKLIEANKEISKLKRANKA